MFAGQVGFQAGRNDEFSHTTSASLKKREFLLVRKECIETMVLDGFGLWKQSFCSQVSTGKKETRNLFFAARFVFQCKTKVCSSRLFLVKNKLWNTHVHTIVSKKTNNQTTKNERRFGTSEFEVGFEI